MNIKVDTKFLSKAEIQKLFILARKITNYKELIINIKDPFFFILKNYKPLKVNLFGFCSKNSPIGEACKTIFFEEMLTILKEHKQNNHPLTKIFMEG